jgi:hypothetical protein
MREFLKLTQREPPRDVWINPDQITQFYAVAEGTLIRLASEQHSVTVTQDSLTVAESLRKLRS